MQNVHHAIDVEVIVQLRREMVEISQQLSDLQGDIRFIKEIFLRKQAKKVRRRQKKDQQRLEAEQARQARQTRATYEEIIWTLSRRPWMLMPTPPSQLSPKELELVSLLANNKTDVEIADRMSIKRNSIRPRICAASKKLKVNNQQELIAYYFGYQRMYREHRRRRCLSLLTWLLNPPPGFINRPNLDVRWKQALRYGRTLRYAGPYVPIKVFEQFRHYEHTALRLKTRGLSYAEIAVRLKLKEPVLRGYFSQIRSDIKRTTGVTISDDQLVSHYKKYLKEIRLREQVK
ncbi:MAG: LuxR C-terminal-related transcriptional regulator [Candidatus Obscuribacterales bacterium]|nr:LuxR C-terminal-related transcriptional regulator [Candidatus Obscuribacterales bacterium]